MDLADRQGLNRQDFVDQHCQLHCWRSDHNQMACSWRTPAIFLRWRKPKKTLDIQY